MFLSKIIKRDKLIYCAISVILISITAHGFMFFNEQLSHDSITLMYNTDSLTMISFGRFIRPIYNAIKGYFCYPTLNGMLSVLFLIGVAYIIIDIFDINSKIFIVFISAILSTNYSVSLLYATYMHDSDAYMFALLLASIALWIVIKHRKYFCISIVLLIASMGIYQSYLDFIILAFLFYLIKTIINNSVNQDSIKEVLVFIFTILTSMILYYLCYKVVIYYMGIGNVSSYQNPSNVLDLSLDSIVNRINTFKESIYKWFILPRGNHRNWVAMINKILLLIDALLLVCSFYISKCNLITMSIVVLLVLLCPLGMNFITLISNVYHDLTIFSFHMFYISPLILIDNVAKHKEVGKYSFEITKGLVYLLLLVLIYDNCLYANENYLKKNLESKTTLMTMTRIIDRIEQTEGYVLGETPVVIVGTLNASDYGVRREGFDYTATGLANTFSISYSEVYSSYFKGYLNYPINLISESERTEIEDDDRVKNMAVFPSKESVAFVDDILVVKLSDYVSDYE